MVIVTEMLKTSKYKPILATPKFTNLGIIQVVWMISWFLFRQPAIQKYVNMVYQNFYLVAWCCVHLHLNYVFCPNYNLFVK